VESIRAIASASRRSRTIGWPWAGRVQSPHMWLTFGCAEMYCTRRSSWNLAQGFHKTYSAVRTCAERANRAEKCFDDMEEHGEVCSLCGGVAQYASLMLRRGGRRGDARQSPQCRSGNVPLPSRSFGSVERATAGRRCVSSEAM
jgi:hypothetical protein